MLKSAINAKNRITATEELSAQVFRHSFGTINLRIEEIRRNTACFKKNDPISNNYI
jgi:hypothetical protein